MRKMIIFDMDGTIADLYGVEGWLDMLRAENTSPYAIARPMYDMATLNDILGMLKFEGYTISVVSWGAKHATAAYDEAVRKVKIEWLKRHNFPFDEVHVVPYGTPKENFAFGDLNILVDDNEEVRNAFLKYHTNRVIDATKNIIAELVNVLVAC